MRISALLLAVGVLLPPTLKAQDSTRTDTTKTVTKVTIPIDFSGVVFGNYQYQAAAGPNKNQNKFDVERAYLTFKMPAGDRASIRVTGDLYQQTASGSDSYYKGWVLRAKYAYLQYDFLKPNKSGDWGFTSRTRSAPGRAQSSRAGSTVRSEMNDRSATVSWAGPPISAGVSARTLVRSCTRTRASLRSRQTSCP